MVAGFSISSVELKVLLLESQKSVSAFGYNY